MGSRFIAPGLAVAAFAVTVGVVAWQGHGYRAPDPRSDVVLVPQRPPAVQTQSLSVAAPLPATTAVAATPAPQLQESLATPDNAAATAAQPTLPETDALPSYQEDQAARTSAAVRSSRVR